jgi:hypothetical protein
MQRDSRNRYRTEQSLRVVPVLYFGYTLGMVLILKLVAGLIEGLRAYFLLAAAAVAIPCLFFLIVFLVGLTRPSRAKMADPQRPRNQ